MGFLPFNSNPESEEDSRDNHATLVYLNVYDLTPMNDYFYMFGVGIYHSGIEGMASIILMLTLLQIV